MLLHALVVSIAIGILAYLRIVKYLAERHLRNVAVKGILHVTVGIDGIWEPTDDELNDIAKLFTAAKEDPAGAVVVTRTGIKLQPARDILSIVLMDFVLLVLIADLIALFVAY